MDLEQEKALVQKSQEDNEAFGELYDEYYTRIFNYTLRRTTSIPVAQDVTSEVFLKALKNIKQFHFRGVPFSSWLYRIATNEVANYFRNNKHKNCDLEEVANSSKIADQSPEAEILEAEEESQRNEKFLILQKSITMLPIKYQEVITLRFFENKQVKEISEILGKREGTIKSLLHRGLEKLGSLLT
jgi:RNA polymerase sigma-70 factor (ECF subfamily)